MTSDGSSSCNIQPPNSSSLRYFDALNFPSCNVTKEPFHGGCLSEEEEERRFLERLESVSWRRYFYHQPKTWQYRLFVWPEPDADEIMNEDLGPRDLGDVKHYNITELNEITESFSDENLIVEFPSQVRLHKGKIRGDSGSLDVIVKTWFYKVPPVPETELFPARMLNEIKLLRDVRVKSEPNLVKLIGFHCDKMLALVFEGGPYKKLADIIFSDDFVWSQRMKVATEIARLLMTFHGHKLVHGGIDTPNILIDENYSPKSFHFLKYSLMEDFPRIYYAQVCGRFGNRLWNELKGPIWDREHDIFTYGVLLQELISKRNVSGYDKFMEDFESGGEKSFVHESFNIEEPFGSEISRLAVRCMQVGSGQRSMPMVVEELEHVVKLIEARASKQQKIGIL